MHINLLGILENPRTNELSGDNLGHQLRHRSKLTTSHKWQCLIFSSTSGWQHLRSIGQGSSVRTENRRSILGLQPPTFDSQLRAPRVPNSNLTVRKQHGRVPHQRNENQQRGVAHAPSSPQKVGRCWQCQVGFLTRGCSNQLRPHGWRLDTPTNGLRP